MRLLSKFWADAADEDDVHDNASVASQSRLVEDERNFQEVVSKSQRKNAQRGKASRASPKNLA